LQVGKKFKTWWGKVYTVDHTSDIAEPVEEPPAAAAQEVLPTPNADQPERQAGQFDGGVHLQVSAEETQRGDALVGAPPPMESRKGT
jgi:hypothetical protein